MIKQRSPTASRLPASNNNNSLTGSAAEPLSSARPLGFFLTYILLPVLFMIIVVFLTVMPLEEYDLWFHLAFARYLFQHGAFPPGDVFSFTSYGREWISTGWLGSVILYGLWEKIGHGSGVLEVTLFVTFHVAATFFCIYAAAVRRKVESAMIFFLLFGIVAACLRFNPRPDIYSQVLTSLMLLVLATAEPAESRASASAFFSLMAEARGRRRPSPIPVNLRRLWLLPPIILLWVNLHAGFMIGVICAGIYGVHRLACWILTRTRDDLLALIPCGLCGVIWMINPYGIRMLALPGKIQAVPHLKEMLFEWMPLYVPNGSNLSMPVYLAAAILVGLCAAAIVARTTRIPWWHWALGILFLAISWSARRQLALTAIALPILMLPHLEGLNALITRRRWLTPVLAAGLTLAIVHLEYSGQIAGGGWPKIEFLPGSFPTETTKFLAQRRPPDNLFNSFHFGGYLMYYLGPETKVFIDGRIDTHSPQVWADDRAIEAGEISLDDAISRYNLNTFIMDRRPGMDPGNMVERLAERPDMRKVAEDFASVVYVRETPETLVYLQQVGVIQPQPK